MKPPQAILTDSEKTALYVADSILLTPDTAEKLLVFGRLLEAKLDADEPRPLSHREYERRYKEWRRNPPENIANRAGIIGINKGIWAVDPYYREVFASLHPDWTPTGRVGRAPGYSPSKRLRISKGEVIARLFELAGTALQAELTTSTTDAS